METIVDINTFKYLKKKKKRTYGSFYSYFNDFLGKIHVYSSFWKAPNYLPAYMGFLKVEVACL